MRTELSRKPWKVYDKFIQGMILFTFTVAFLLHFFETFTLNETFPCHACFWRSGMEAFVSAPFRNRPKGYSDLSFDTNITWVRFALITCNQRQRSPTNQLHPTLVFSFFFLTIFFSLVASSHFPISINVFDNKTGLPGLSGSNANKCEAATWASSTLPWVFASSRQCSPGKWVRLQWHLFNELIRL